MLQFDTRKYVNSHGVEPGRVRPGQGCWFFEIDGKLYRAPVLLHYSEAKRWASKAAHELCVNRIVVLP